MCSVASPHSGHSCLFYFLGPTNIGPHATALFVPQRADISSVTRDDNMSAFDVTCIVSGY